MCVATQVKAMFTTHQDPIATVTRDFIVSAGTGVPCQHTVWLSVLAGA
jgi:hypothetical protein